MTSAASQHLSLTPLGAGDLIDRSVRLYRSHFVTLIRIAALPVLVSAAGSAVWTWSTREIPRTSSEAWLALYFALAAVAALLLVGSNLLYLIVMGGAARNLVAHLLWSEPVSVRATYRNVRARFWGLLGASFILLVITVLAAGVALFAWVMTFSIMSFVLALLLTQAPVWITAIVGVVGTLVTALGALWLFFWIVGRVVYVPQVLLVEGKGVWAAVNRSAALAQGNARRLAALVGFSLFATYAALALLAVPLGWYAYLHGLNLLPFGGDNHPIWYEISYNALAQASTMLLAPVLIIGMSLLYIDERVRREAYDVELMAMSRLGPIPKLKDGRLVPFAPALVPDPAQLVAERWPEPRAGSVLGLH